MDIVKRIDKFQGDWSDAELIHDAAMDARDEIIILRAKLAQPTPSQSDDEPMRYLVQRFSEGMHEKDEYFATKESAYYSMKGQIVDTPYDDWIANIDAMKDGK